MEVKYIESVSYIEETDLNKFQSVMAQRIGQCQARGLEVIESETVLDRGYFGKVIGFTRFKSAVMFTDYYMQKVNEQKEMERIISEEVAKAKTEQNIIEADAVENS